MREGDVKEAVKNIWPVKISTGYGCQLEVELVSAPGQPVISHFIMCLVGLSFNITFSNIH